MNKQEILNEIQEAKARLEEAEKKLKNHEENTYERWKPKCGYSYFCVNNDNKVNEYTWNNDFADYDLFRTFNCFQTKEEAEQEAEKILVRRQLEDIAKRLNKGNKMNWTSPNQCQYYLYFEPLTSRILTNSISFAKQQGSVYCLSSAFKDVAIKEIGEERLLKYLKGEKENDR